MAIIRNSAKCLHCNDVIESKHRHDFVQCSCWSDPTNEPHHGIFVDGGHDYLRHGCYNHDEYMDLSITEYDQLSEDIDEEN